MAEERTEGNRMNIFTYCKLKFVECLKMFNDKPGEVKPVKVKTQYL